MRISSSQCALVLLLTISISGCYSGGKWSMPNLAFWKSSPFSSSNPSTSTAGTYPPAAGSPVKPSALAANNSSGALTTAPPYQSTLTPGTVTPAMPGAVSQYPYPSTTTSPAAAAGSPAYTASATNSVTANTYMAPQQGPYGSTGTTPTNPSNSINTYPATASYNSYPNNSYSNPVRPQISSSTNLSAPANDRYSSASGDRYGSSSDRYGSIPDRNTSADRYGSSSDRYPNTPDRYAPAGSAPTGGASTLPAAGTSYGNNVQGIAPPASYNRTTAPASTQASISDNRYGDTRSGDSSPYAPSASSTSNASTAYGSSTPADRYAPASDPAAAGRYTSPSTSPDGSNPLNSNSGGYGGNPGYSPGNSGAAPTGAISPYTPPSTSAPAGTTNDAGAYRPGSVTTYTPRKSGPSS
ncbi:MAG: hypothetical protein ABSA26_08570, partial [Thermoguttaceae bacterium]